MSCAAPSSRPPHIRHRCLVQLLLALLLVTPQAAWPQDSASPPVLKVEITGVGEEELRNVRSLLSLVALESELAETAGAEGEARPEVHEAHLRRLHAQAEQQIATALQPFGYYRPTVHGELTSSDGTWLASYQIEPGPRMDWASVDLQVSGGGAEDSAFRDLQAAFPLRAGEPVNHATYQEAKDRLLALAAERGYFDAHFTTSELRIDLEAYQATAVLHFDTGPRYRFGLVSFQQDVLEPTLLERYLPFKPGDPFSQDELIRLEGNLRRTDYFREVTIQPQPEQAEELAVPVEVRLTPARRWVYAGGIGYGTDTGARLTFNLTQRRLNRYGHHGDLALKVSELELSGSTQYVIPGGGSGFLKGFSALTFNAGYFDLNPRTSDSEKAVVGARLQRARKDWQQVFSLNFERTHFTVGLDTGLARLLVPGISWTWVSTDDRIHPTRGTSLGLQLQGSDDTLLSTETFLQVQGRGKVVHPLGERFRLIGRAEAGTLLTPDFRRLPPSLRFFAGGDQSIRGFGYKELGDRDAEGTLIGGKSLLVGSLELEARIYQEWGAAIFFDAGNALDNPLQHLEKGAGIGARWFSPVGLFRIDFAWALTAEGTPMRVHLGFGLDL